MTDKEYLEIWKDIIGYEGLYQISNLGSVKSLERYRAYKNGKPRHMKSKKLIPGRSKCGYYTVVLYKEGKRKTHTIHRLVAKAFIPNPNNYPYVNHIDENKTNNHISNLEWCTASYNSRHGTRIERFSKAMSGENNFRYGKHLSEEHRRRIGEANKKNRLSEERKQKLIEANCKKVICITTGEVFESIKEASEKYNIDPANISSCCRGKRKTAGKMQWNLIG